VGLCVQRWATRYVAEEMLRDRLATVLDPAIDPLSRAAA